VAGSIDVFVLSWLLSGSLTITGGIASSTVVTKSGLYYLHERAWTRIDWGRHGHSIGSDRPTLVLAAANATGGFARRWLGCHGA
jgi:uncharacterized membrane protein